MLWNHALAETYPHLAAHLNKGLTFAQLTRLNLEGGGQPEQADRAQEWLALRLAQRRRGEQPSQLMNNGRGRWLRMAETRLRDGSIVAIRVDVTDFEDQRRALEQARQAWRIPASAWRTRSRHCPRASSCTTPTIG